MTGPDIQGLRDTFSRLMIEHYDVDFVDDLFSAADDVSTHAAEEFAEIFCHQGDIYPHSPVCVPHLVTALGMVGPGARAELIYLLGGIATGLQATNGNENLIADATRAVFAVLPDLEYHLTDEDERVRIAALITLTDLARINAPKMRYPSGPPSYVGAHPDEFSPEGFVEHLRILIEGCRDKFDEVWRLNCEVGLAYLAFETPPSATAHPFWEMLDRH